MKFLSEMRRLSWLFRDKPRARKSRTRSPIQLHLEALEDRTVPSVLPAPLVSDPRSISGPGFSPVVVADPLLPQHLVAVFNTAATVNGNTVMGVSVEFSVDDGQNWGSFGSFSNIVDPNSPVANPFTFIQDSAPSAAFDRQHNVYIVFTQHDATSTSGALVLEKLSFANGIQRLINNEVLSRWFQVDPVLNPVVGVDNNLPTFSDTAPNGATQTQTDTMVDKAVYVAWNTNNTAPTLPGTAINFNPSTIKVIASGDGGQTFTDQEYVNDGASNPNYTVSNNSTNFTAERDSAPQIVFSQGSADGAIPGGQLTFVWNDFGRDRIVTDTTQPDGGVQTQPAAEAVVLSSPTLDNSTTGPTAGHINDGFENGGSGTDLPDTPVSTPFTQTLTAAEAATLAGSLADLTVTLSMIHPHMNQVSITLSAKDANGNPFLDQSGNPIVVTLLAAHTASDGTTNFTNVGITDQANLGEINRDSTTPPTFQPIGTTFDQQAPRSINDPGDTEPYIGHFRPEDGPTSGLNFGGLEAFRGLTQAQLAGSVWTLTITDDHNDADDNTKQPVQFLQDWSLNFTSSISTGGFGVDTNVQVPAHNINNRTIAASPVDGAATGPFPLQGANGQFPLGIGPAPVIAVDNTLGSYSPYQGRMYIAYVGFSTTLNGKSDATDIFLIHSDNNGKSWSAPVRVNQDGSADGFSEGDRPKFNPVVAVDQTTGTVVVSWFDTRWDASRARPVVYVSTSIDGGQTFGGESFLNTPKTAIDAITGQTDVLQPVPNSTEANAGSGGFGFGTQQGLVVNAGHVVSVFAGNLNAVPNPQVLVNATLQTATVAIAAGPRIVSGDMGPVANDFSAGAVTYNNTFASDGTRQLTGFVVTFDRPVDATTFTPGDVTVTYHDTTTPAGQPGTAMTVSSVQAVDGTTRFGPRGVGGLDANGKATLATQFLVSVIDPATGNAPSRVGTYSYTVGPNIQDRLGSVVANVTPVGPPQTFSASGPQVPQTVTDNTTTVSHLTVSGIPAGQVVSTLTVSLKIDNYPYTGDLQITLTDPNGNSVLLFNQEPSAFSGDPSNPGLGPITFDDAAAQSLANGSPPYSGTFKPDGSLTSLAGVAPNGQWTLTVKDLYPGTPGTDVGTLSSWSVNIQPGVQNSFTHVGNKMDQNANGVTGENPGDVFAVPRPLNGVPGVLPYSQDTLPLIIPGPHIVSTFVNGNPATADNLVLNGTTSTIDVVFDRNMNPATFNAANVLRMMGPLGLVNDTFVVTPDPNPGYARLINGVLTSAADPDPTHPRTYKITFEKLSGGTLVPDAQYLNGTYTLTFSPTAQDTNGDAVDTNLNAGVDVLRGANSTVGTLSTNTYPSSTTAVDLAPGRTAVSKITVPDDFLVQGATLTLNINNNDGNNSAIDPFLTATLVGPTGASVRLFTNVGDQRSPNGFRGTVFDDNATTPIQDGVPPFNVGTFNPQTPLSALGGNNALGAYTLIISNSSTSLHGTLDSWTLKLEKSTPPSGLGEPVADQFSASFRIFTADPTNPLTHQDWFAVGPASENSGGNSGRVTGLAIDPSDPSGNTVYVGGASGGIWKTTDFLTNAPQGPTYIPLTDFGETFAINIGAIAVFARNNDPRQSIIIAGTGEGDTGTPGVGFLISQDGGATWTLLDSTTNVDANGNPLPISSPLRDHKFVGTNSFKIVVDPTLTSTNNVIIYAALSGPNGGIWISRDTGKHWGQLDQNGNTLGTPNLAGQATDVVLAAGSAAADGLLQVVYAAVAGQGVFLSQNQGLSFAQTADGSAAHPYQGDQEFRDNVTGNAIPVANPSDSPNGAKGRIALVTPFLTGDKLKDFFYEGWIYAAVIMPDGNFDGLYLSKDFGGNWTKVLLPELQVFNNLGKLVSVFPSNDTNNPNINPTGYLKFVQGNYDISLGIDPTNPNVVYIGGTDDAAPESAGGEIRVDTTGLADPHALVAYDNTNPDGGLVQFSTTGSVSVKPPPPVGREPSVNGITQDYLNLYRDPNNPFLTSSTVIIGNVQQFNNDGSDIRGWTSFSDVMGGSTDQHRVISFVDPLTGHARLIFADDQGVWTGVDMGDGTLDLGIGSATAPTFSRNGNLQIAQFYGGTSQPSILASQVAGALFYGRAQDDGSPQSDPSILQDGNLNWTGPTGDATWVVTDQTGGGTMLDYKWPCCNPLTPTDFLQITRPGSSAVGDTGTIGASLIQAGDDPSNSKGEWPFEGGSHFAINPVDPNGLVISSQAGRVFRTTDQGLHWFIIGQPTDLDSTYAQAMAFGAPDPNATSGNLNQFIYAGTTGGKMFVTFTGGGYNGGSKWLDISAGLDGSAVQEIVTDPRRGSHDAYAVTLKGVYFMANSLPSASNPTPTWVNITGDVFALTHNPFGNAALNQTQLQYLTSIAADWRYAIPNDPKNPNGPNHPILYVAGEGGVYRSTDQGKTWTIFPDVKDDGAVQDGGMLPDAHITNLSLAQGNINPANGQPSQPGGPDLLIATTYGRGMFAIHLPMTGMATPVSGPRVVSAVTNGAADGSSVSSLTVTFSGPVDPTTFTLIDIDSFVGPNGAIAVTGVTDITPNPATGGNPHNIYRIDFATQSTVGTYRLTLGPNISDFAGDYMDQNQNGVNGENPGDQFTANFFVKTSVAGTVPHPVPVVLGLSGSGLEALFPSGSGFTASAAGVFPTLPAGEHWVDALTGDFNGDGKTDYAARVLETGQWYVALSNGNTFTVHLWDTWSPNVTWVDVAAGYFQGHNKPEDIVGRVLQPDAQGLTDVFVSVPTLDANGELNSGTTTLWDRWQGVNADGSITQWFDTRVGDFTGDGKDDLVSGFINFGGVFLNPATGKYETHNFRDVFVAESNGTSFAQVYWQSWFSSDTAKPTDPQPWANVVVGDFKGDGFAALAARFIPNGAVYLSVDFPTTKESVRQFGNNNINNPIGQLFWQQWSTAANWVDVKVGRFLTSDAQSGKDDLVARDLNSGNVYVSEQYNPNYDYNANYGHETDPGANQYLWTTLPSSTNFVDTQVADFNGDGLSDIVSRYAPTGQWFVWYSTGSNTPGFGAETFAATWDPSKPWVDVLVGKQF